MIGPRCPCRASPRADPAAGLRAFTDRRRFVEWVGAASWRNVWQSCRLRTEMDRCAAAYPRGRRPEARPGGRVLAVRAREQRSLRRSSITSTQPSSATNSRSGFQQTVLTACHDQECALVSRIVVRHASPPCGTWPAGYSIQCDAGPDHTTAQVRRPGARGCRGGTCGASSRAAGRLTPAIGSVSVARLTPFGATPRVASWLPAAPARPRTSSPWAISPSTSSRAGFAPAARRSTRGSSPTGRACGSGS